MYSLLLKIMEVAVCFALCLVIPPEANIKTNYEGACSMDPQSIIIYILYC